MKINHILDIATALLLARWKQTGIAAVGVMFSIALFVTLLGFMEGLNKLLDSLVVNRTPHIRLFNDLNVSTNQPINFINKSSSSYNFISSIKPVNARKEIYNANEIINSLNKDRRILGVAPKVTAQVLFNIGTIDLNGVVNGIDINLENKLFFFKDYILSGNYNDLETISNSIILGSVAAEKMMINVGDVVTLTTTTGEHFSLKVVGLFQSGMAEIDKTQSYASLKTTQKLLGQTNSYFNDIQIKLLDINQAPKLAQEYHKLYEIEAEDIQSANAQFETGGSVRSTISYAVGVTLLIVSGFGIYNILNMLIYEKMDTIAILKATGFESGDIKKIFIFISLIIGVSGGIAGLILGFILSSIVNIIPFTISALPTVKTYPMDYGIHYYLISISFALVITYFAGWFPARRASKLDPVIIIRVR